jgi:hypothetical protein
VSAGRWRATQTTHAMTDLCATSKQLVL